jgi:hypothetical protein
MMPTPDHTPIFFSFTQIADVCWFVVGRSVTHVAPMDHRFFTLRVKQGQTRPCQTHCTRHLLPCLRVKI